MIKLNGKRIILRWAENKDVKDLCENAHDNEIAKNTRVPYPYQEKHAKDFIKKSKQFESKKENLLLVIELKQEKKVIGTVSLMRINWKHNNSELGYWLGKNYRGQKLMNEVIPLILEYGFKKLKLERIFAQTFDFNEASQKLLEKHKFKYEGTLRNAEKKKNKYLDLKMYSLLKKEFKK